MILLYFDDKYAYWASVILDSILLHEPDMKVFIQGYNLTKKQLKEINSFSNVVLLKNDKLEFDKSIMDKIEYRVICWKANQFLEAFERFPDEDLFIIMDVDMILVQPLTKLKNDMKNYDLGAVWVSRKKIMGGFNAIRRSHIMVDFLKSWSKKITTGRYTYNKDQSAMAKTFNEFLGKIDFLLLTRQYLDHLEKKDSYVWSAHKVSTRGLKIKRFKKYTDYNKKLGKIGRNMEKEDQLELLEEWKEIKYCIEIQKRFGDYDEFTKKQGNKENKIPIFQLMYNLLKQNNNQLSLLDVGCGPGHFLWSFKNNVSKIIGLDNSKSMLILAKKQLDKHNILSEFTEGSCWELPFSDNYVDISLQVDVCMHIGGTWKSLNEMIRVSKKYIVLTGPSFEDFDNVMDKQIRKHSYAVSTPLLKKELDIFKKNNIIKSYDFLERPKSKTYNHKILFVEKI